MQITLITWNGDASKMRCDLYCWLLFFLYKTRERNSKHTKRTCTFAVIYRDFYYVFSENKMDKNDSLQWLNDTLRILYSHYSYFFFLSFLHFFHSHSLLRIKERIHFTLFPLSGTVYLTSSLLPWQDHNEIAIYSFL